MLKKDNSMSNETTIICVLSLIINDNSFTGKKPPDEIRVKAKLRELKALIEKIFKEIKMNKVKPEYNKNILIACLKISELSNEIKLVKVFLKFSS
tara:strand:+ start:142 stop:426 length:285 start_codon:yes stop_codon:yes gene_type:complete